MPSPLGHALAGAAISLVTDRPTRTARWASWLAVCCALLAAAPDLDLLIAGAHRTWSHSLLSILVVLVAAGAITRVAFGSVQRPVVLACALAWASHLLFDYFGVDLGTPAGIQLFWPWDHTHYISSWPVFLGTERHDPFSSYAMWKNAQALARELVLLTPILALCWLRRRRLARSSAPARSLGSNQREAESVRRQT